MIEEDIKVKFDNWLEFNHLSEVSEDIKTILFEQFIKTLNKGNE